MAFLASGLHCPATAIQSRSILFVLCRPMLILVHLDGDGQGKVTDSEAFEDSHHYPKILFWRRRSVRQTMTLRLEFREFWFVESD